MNVLWLRVKKRLVYCAVAVIWIIIPIYTIIAACLSSDIIKGTCMQWNAFISYGAEKTINWSILISTYLVPMVTMMFLYARVIHALKTKVTSIVSLSRLL